MENVKKNFGFGCIRLPMNGEQVDFEETKRMVDAFLDAGFNYFDTAHGYIQGMSETALRECLTSRYPRDRYILTNKLTGNFFKTEADIRPFFESQLQACGVEYFDYYLMHAQGAGNYDHYRACRAYETAFALKAEGKVRHVGISFHDRAEVLEQILTDYPEIEVVQIQFNYMDYDDTAVQSRKCYGVCVKHGKPVIVMEPVKGGTLANPPQNVQEMLHEAHPDWSPAEWAIRFAASLENVMVVLSGMSDLAQLDENTGFMQDFTPLTEEDQALLLQAAEKIRAGIAIPCTGCRYCVEASKCPKNILIPNYFALFNTRKLMKRRDFSPEIEYYENYLSQGYGKASDCIACKSCERVCPQHIHISEWMPKLAENMENGQGF